MFKKHWLLFLFLCMTSATALAQDIHFSQFRYAPLIQNPAFAGSERNVRAILNYRNQWKSIGKLYRTSNFSCDLPLTGTPEKSGYLAAGLDVFSDKAGQSEMSSLEACVSIAYHLNIGEFSGISAGLQGGYMSRSVNRSSLTWGSQYDGYSYNSALPSGDPNIDDKVNYPDFGAGINYSFSKGEKYMTGNDQRKANVGIALFHPNKPDYSFYGTGEQLNMKFVAHGDYLIGIPNTNLSVIPAFVYYQQGSQDEINVGSTFRYLLKEESNYTGFEQGRAINLGVHFRIGDAVIPSLLVEVGPFDMGVSYDINLSSLENATSSRGGMELALRYIGKKAGRRSGANRY